MSPTYSSRRRKHYPDRNAMHHDEPGAYIVFDQLAQVGESHGKACREALQYVERGEDPSRGDIRVPDLRIHTHRRATI